MKSASSTLDSPTKFYQEDVVRFLGEYAIITRCWHDAEDHPPPEHLQSDPFLRPLKRGEVGLSILPSGAPKITWESNLELLDRTCHIGDYVKRSNDDVQSGVVVSVDVKAKLEHAVSREEVPGWRCSDEFERTMHISTGDYLAYDDCWIGQLIETFDEAIVEVYTGHLVRLPEYGSRLNVGDRGHDIMPERASQPTQSLFGFLMGNRPGVDTVVDVKHTVLAVNWLAINQMLNPLESQNRQRPQRIWYGNEISKLTLIRGKSEDSVRVGDHVHMKNTEGLPVTRHRQAQDVATPDRHLGGVLEVKQYIVRETATEIKILWQDGTEEIAKATDMIPYLNPDEYDCWPGDVVIWKNEEAKRTAIVQSVNATDRIARIRCTDTQEIELVSVLELDAHGTSEGSPEQVLFEGLGVRRGDFAFIHPEGSTNGYEFGKVPRIGELEEWTREAPLDEDGQLKGWRKEMVEIGGQAASRRGTTDEMPIGQLQSASSRNGSLHWFGEVIGVHLDGTVTVVFPDATHATLPLERLTRLFDAVEQLENDSWLDDDQESGDEGSQDYVMHDASEWQPTDIDNHADWEEMGDSEDTEDTWQDDPIIQVEGEGPLYACIPHTNAADTSASSASCSSTPVRTPLEEVEEPTNEDLEEDGLDGPWSRFAVLSSAPADHAYYSTPNAQSSRTFHSRLAKEYKILSTSLPESIIVRAYEDRGDLLRCMIIGPEGTPYADAPFVIDWNLEDFPNSPPKAHFFSWTNGNGRVNPNLYEEGKICLSLLNTWAGHKDESWSPSRSSLLQVMVSIQGLILVTEPYFCEPAYAKLRGTEEGAVNSRLYSEKAFVLSRGFIRHALETPLSGLEDELNWMYYKNRRLAEAIRKSQELIEQSRQTSSKVATNNTITTDHGVPFLSAGGIMTLERTLKKLQALLDAHTPT